jgi:threonine aldolase
LPGHGFESVRSVLAGLVNEVEADERQDHYGGGSIIEAFECEVAELLGKESAVFLLTIGDAAASISDDEVRTLMERVLAAGQ